MPPAPDVPPPPPPRGPPPPPPCVATPEPALPRMPWALLVACCLGMFAASSSGTTRAPFLIDMARDLGTSVALVANLMAMTSIAWGAASLVAGAGSDRWGRRPFLVGGPVGLALCMAGVSTAGSYFAAALW